MRRVPLFCFATALWAAGAMAHSQLHSSVPNDGAVVVAAPSEVMLNFGTTIRLTRVSATLGGGDPVPLDLSNNTSFATEFTLPFADAGPGEYVIEWRGLSADGHAVSGAFTFTVE